MLEIVMNLHAIAMLSTEHQSERLKEKKKHKTLN